MPFHMALWLNRQVVRSRVAAHKSRYARPKHSLHRVSLKESTATSNKSSTGLIEGQAGGSRRMMYIES